MLCIKSFSAPLESRTGMPTVNVTALRKHDAVLPVVTLLGKVMRHLAKNTLGKEEVDG